MDHSYMQFLPSLPQVLVALNHCLKRHLGSIGRHYYYWRRGLGRVIGGRMEKLEYVDSKTIHWTSSATRKCNLISIAESSFVDADDTAKVDVPNSNTTMIWTPIFE